MLSRRSARSVERVVRLDWRSVREDCSSGEVGLAVARMRRYDEKRWRVEVRVVCTSLEEILGGLGRGLGEIYCATSRKGSPGSGLAMLGMQVIVLRNQLLSHRDV